MVLLFHPIAQSPCTSLSSLAEGPMSPVGSACPTQQPLDPPELGLGYLLSPCTPCAGFGVPRTFPIVTPGWDWVGVGCSSSPLMCPILPQYLEVLRSQQNRPAKCLTVLWALGQAGFTDLHEGLKGESQGWDPLLPGHLHSCWWYCLGVGKGWERSLRSEVQLLPARRGKRLDPERSYPAWKDRERAAPLL